MAQSSIKPTALVWMDPVQGPLVARIAELAGLEIMKIGMPSAAARALSPEMPEPLMSVERFTDPLHALATEDVDLVLLASARRAEPSGVSGRNDLFDDEDLRSMAQSSKARVFSLAAGSRRDCHLDFVPLLSASRVMASAREALETFGPVRSLHISFRCGCGQGGLGARLFDAMHLVHAILGAPESVDASIVAPVTASGETLALGETLIQAQGDLAAVLRFAGARAASLSLSDRAGRWFRGVTIMGESGCLRLDEGGFERIDGEGHVIDTAQIEPKTSTPRSGPIGAEHESAVAIAESIVRALDAHAVAPEPIDEMRVLASCRAALLSARTGQSESPATMMEMSRSA